MQSFKPCASRPRAHIAGALTVVVFSFAATASGQTPWTNFAKNAHHTASSATASQVLNSIHWQTPVDLHPPDAASHSTDLSFGVGELLIHYGSPLITAANTVIVPVKTGASGGFRAEAHNASNGDVVWSMPTDYALPPPHGWTPVFGPALSAERLNLPAAGGTIIFRDSPDSATGTKGRLAFYRVIELPGESGRFQQQRLHQHASHCR